jgi:hypothetical protein
LPPRLTPHLASLLTSTLLYSLRRQATGRCCWRRSIKPQLPPSSCDVTAFKLWLILKLLRREEAPQSELVAAFFVCHGHLMLTSSSGRPSAPSTPPQRLAVLRPPPRVINQPPTTADYPLHADFLGPPAHRRG